MGVLTKYQRQAINVLRTAKGPVCPTKAGIAPITMAVLRRMGVARRTSGNCHELTDDWAEKATAYIRAKRGA